MTTRRVARRERGGASASLRSLHPGVPRPDWWWLVALDAWPPALFHVVVAGGLAAVAILDALTGGRLGFWALYLLPIGVAAWWGGPRIGVVWAIAGAMVWVAVDVTVVQGDVGVTMWNAVLRLAVFVVVAMALAELRRQRDAVRTLAGTDHLTGVQNARSFHALVELERSRALRYNRPFTLAYLDVDGFRVVNEEWGHGVGDQALRLVAATIREHIRSMDSVSRMGGDEFALLLPETGQGAAQVALRKIQGRLVEAAGERSLALTFTAGAVICVGAPESVDDLIERAESLMYNAKRAGGGGIRTEVLDENFGIEAILKRG